jgi:hypothetical protein
MDDTGAKAYRNLVRCPLAHFSVRVKETDILVYSQKPLEKESRESVLKHRAYLEQYIETFPDFALTLNPWPNPGPAAEIIREMAWASQLAGVGPMAAVAGTIAELVGKDLLKDTPEVIVENGGDVFMKTSMPTVLAIFAGRSPLSLKIGLKIDSSAGPVSVCTSSGTIGHSKSFGRSDAVCVVSHSCSLADAAATSIANRVISGEHISNAIDFGKQINGIHGIVIIIGEHLGVWGALELIALKGKKG